MSEEDRKPQTTQEALLTEMLGDIGKLHDYLRTLEGSQLFQLMMDLRKQVQELRNEREGLRGEREKLDKLADKIRPLTMDGFDITSKAPEKSESSAFGYLFCIILGAVVLGVAAHYFPPLVGLTS
jgi:hypothetical protein